MGVTEYVLGFAAIVLALGLEELLKGLAHLMRRGAFRRVPLPNYLFAGIVVLNMVFFWWSMWLWRDVRVWTAPGFLTMLVSLGALYLMAQLTFPVGPDASWRDHYYEQAPKLWGLLLLLFLGALTTGYLVRGDPFRLADLLPAALLGAGWALALRTRSALAHGLANLVVLALLVVEFFRIPSLTG